MDQRKKERKRARRHFQFCLVPLAELRLRLRCVLGLALLFAGPAAAYQPACDGRLPLLRRAPLVASSSAVAAPQSRASDRQLYLLFGSRFVQSIMRLAMGPLVVYVCGDMACDASSRGQLLSSYSLG